MEELLQSLENIFFIQGSRKAFSSPLDEPRRQSVKRFRRKACHLTFWALRRLMQQMGEEVDDALG